MFESRLSTLQVHHVLLTLDTSDRVEKYKPWNNSNILWSSAVYIYFFLWVRYLLRSDHQRYRKQKVWKRFGLSYWLNSQCNGYKYIVKNNITKGYKYVVINNITNAMVMNIWL